MVCIIVVVLLVVETVLARTMKDRHRNHTNVKDRNRIGHHVFVPALALLVYDGVCACSAWGVQCSEIDQYSRQEVGDQCESASKAS